MGLGDVGAGQQSSSTSIRLRVVLNLNSMLFDTMITAHRAQAEVWYRLLLRIMDFTLTLNAVDQFIGRHMHAVEHLFDTPK